MAGSKHSKEVLNRTLLFISKLLNDNGINDWFIAYGTLLGITREGSCIDNDDDVDIVTNKINYDAIRKLLTDNGIEITRRHKIGDSKNLIKTVPTDIYGSIDIYMADVNKQSGDFFDKWVKALWTNCYCDNELPKIEWNGQYINVPMDIETKLINRYGDKWRIPRDVKCGGKSIRKL